MASFAFLPPLLLGIALGALAVWLILRNSAARSADHARAQAAAELGAQTAALQATLASCEQQLASARNDCAAANEKISRLTAENATAHAHIQAREDSLARERVAFEESRRQLKTEFENLAAKVLDATSNRLKADFEEKQGHALELAAEKEKAISSLLDPLKESLKNLETQSRDLELKRERAYSAITGKIDEVTAANRLLQGETAKLATALTSPTSSGDWGEYMLARVVELAGMTERCDFEHQVRSKDGNYRPDMIVQLPNGRRIIVDSKTSVKSFQEAYETSDMEERKAKLLEHSKKLRGHITALATKGYELKFENSIELVVCFIPGDVFQVAALSVDRDIWEFAAKQNVLIATPTSLLGLLKAAAFGWQQDAINRETVEVRNLGKTLYERLVTAVGHLEKLQKSIDGTVNHWDAFIGSMEASVFPAARRMKSLGIPGAEMKKVEQIDKRPRLLALAESQVIESVAANGELPPQ